MKPIYLDYNATTPLDPRVVEAMLPFLHEHFGNPSSGHAYGAATRRAVEDARARIANMLQCRPEEVIFTSGGSESNNYAIKGVVGIRGIKGCHIITSSVEHPAVTEVCRFLEEKGCTVTFLPVDGHGLVNPRDVESAITPQTILITIMHANNEVGSIEPIAEIAEIAHRRGVLLHTDAAQSVGKIPVLVDELKVDLLSIAGHKLYAPKGIGALYIRTGVQLEKQVHGAGHEMGLRAGTENVLEIVGLGEACRLVAENLESYSRHMETMRNRLENGLKERYPTLRVNGHPQKRLPNTLSVSFKGMEANAILFRMENVAASAGSACHSGGVTISSVLQAMHVPLDYAMGTLRFSVGRFTTAEEIDRSLEEIDRVVRKLLTGA